MITTSPSTILQNVVSTTDGDMGFDRTNEDLSIGDGAAAQLVHMGAWKTFTVTVTGFSSNPANMVGRYSLVGKTCTMVVYMPTTGTSNATTLTVTAPFTSANQGVQYQSTNGQCTDGGAYYGAVFADLSPNSTSISLSRAAGTLGWTASLGKSANFMLTFEII